MKYKEMRRNKSLVGYIGAEDTSHKYCCICGKIFSTLGKETRCNYCR